LAEAVARQSGAACDVQTHRITNSPAFAALPPSLQRLSRRRFDLPDAELIIGCGRQAIAPLLALRQSGRDAFTVYVQDPRIDLSRFDLIVAPLHDGLIGPNVESMIGSPNRITRDAIIGGTLSHAGHLSTLPMPRAMIAIGGPSRTHTMHGPTIKAHLDTGQRLLERGYSLLITTSRRTPGLALTAWQDFAAGRDNIWLHTPDSDGDNPYFAFLGGADIILVSEDSTNMLTEACATGKPVYRLPMDGKMRDAKAGNGKAGKFAQLYTTLEERCHVKRWDPDQNGPRPYPALDETNRIAARILARLAAR
jgi:mitochondrial fission protein ELM1